MPPRLGATSRWPCELLTPLGCGQIPTLHPQREKIDAAGGADNTETKVPLVKGNLSNIKCLQGNGDQELSWCRMSL